MTDKAWEIVNNRAMVTKKSISKTLSDIIFDYHKMKKDVTLLKEAAARELNRINQAKVLKDGIKTGNKEEKINKKVLSRT